MKSLRFLSIMFALPLLNLAQTPDPVALTNQRVIEMVQIGVSPREVRKVICAAPPGTVDFNLTPSGGDQLWRARIFDETIKLMAAKQHGLPCMVADGPKPWPREFRGEALIVPESTPVRLRLTRNLSSAHERTDDTVKFEVLEDVTLPTKSGKNFLVIERGASALGTITNSNPSSMMGRAGTVELTMDFVKLANGEKIALTANMAGDRNGHAGAVVLLLSPVGLVYVPKDPPWVTGGKESTIKDGFHITAFTDGVANLDSTDFEQR